MKTSSIHGCGPFAIALGLYAAAALAVFQPATAAAGCAYPSYLDCLQAGETVEFCKKHVLNCDSGGAGQGGSGGNGGGDDAADGDGDHAEDCPYGTYIECLQAGLGVDFCKRHALHCNDYPGGGGAGGQSDPCNPLEDEAGIGCDGNPTWVNFSDPYDFVASEATVCPYDSYLECLQAGETVEFCKRHVLNCDPGAPTEAQATVDFEARQCTLQGLCLCDRASGQITFYGITVIKDDEICLQISHFDYQGSYPGQVEPEIIAELDAIGWEVCIPLECI